MEIISSPDQETAIWG